MNFFDVESLRSINVNQSCQTDGKNKINAAFFLRKVTKALKEINKCLKNRLKQIRTKQSIIKPYRICSVGRN